MEKELIQNKSLILLRGLPGRGKSTLATLLSEQNKYPILSIDNYFIDTKTGEYSFSHLSNHIAYKQCEEKTKIHLQEGSEKVFVDNTFTLEWEMEPYFKMANEFNYRIFVITVENRHRGKNIHNIPFEQVEKMAKKYRVQLL